MLYVMAERWPKAGRYRDTFERLKQLVLGRDHAEEKDDNIVLDPPTNEAGLGAELARSTITTENVASGHNQSLPPVPDTGTTRTRSATSASVIPNVIRNLVREPFPLWESENLNLNFEALMPQPLGSPSSTNGPWAAGDMAFGLNDATSFDFTFSPGGFQQPSDYDFDPVTFEYTPRGMQVQGNEYGGILEGLADKLPATHL